MARVEIAETLISLLSYQGFSVSGRDGIFEALEIYSVSSLDFADALAAAHVLHDGLEAVVSYDTDFDRIGVPRVEP